MIFEAGIFFTLLGLAFLFFFIKVPYKEAFLFMSCVIFFVLGFMLYSDYIILFTTSESSLVTEFNGTDITNTITSSTNMTYNIFGTETITYNDNTKFLALILIVMGIVTGLISFVMFTRTGKPNEV